MRSNRDGIAALERTFSALTAENNERHAPFRWQMRLLRRMLDNDLPAAVDLPTGLGKTSVMALWLIARAQGAALPRRLVYVVDRRAVVDQATRFADRLRRNLRTLPDLAGSLGLGDSCELPISTLRGGFADNRQWLEDPSKPAIIVGTVDMIGSRLLFEGYGVSRRMRPFHAGLLGADALLLLDEAHLCPPFQALLRRIANADGGEFGPLPDAPDAPPLRLLSLSATGRGMASEIRFGLAEEDRAEAAVRTRLEAEKRLRIEEIESDKALADELAKRAIGYGATDKPARVLVYCHSRKDALDIKGRIDKECRRRRRSGQLGGDAQSELLVGERRVRERALLEKWLTDNGFLGGAQSPPAVPTFLIATSAGEVGVDLNADHMVCDLVAYERMVQRLGRVNRRGGTGRTAFVDVLAPQSQKKPQKKPQKEPESLAVLRKPFDLLPPLPSDADGRRDASPSAVTALKHRHPESVAAATSPVPLHPALTRPLLDAWSMTSLDAHEGRPEVAPWLRGWEEEEDPQCDVVWRKHLPVGNHASAGHGLLRNASSFFQVAPVHATEKLEAPVSRVFDWLAKRGAQASRLNGDGMQGISPEEIVAILIDRSGDIIDCATLARLQLAGCPMSRLTPAEKKKRASLQRQWRERNMPGAILIVDARLCGLSKEGMLDDTAEAVAPPAIDDDPAWSEQAGFRVVPVHADGADADGETGLAPPPAEPGWNHVRTFETSFTDAGAPSAGLAVLNSLGNATDEDSRSVAPPQTLRAHAEDVERHARKLAARIGLPRDEVEALAAAARMHDDGKAADRWQRAMNAPKQGGPFAKIGGGGHYRMLEGYRHEFGSLMRAEREELPESSRDLILHLIAAHHGFARPVIRSSGCDEGPPSLMEAKAGEVAQRFARLQKRYGPWGLAWREAILRAADMNASREWEARHAEKRNG